MEGHDPGATLERLGRLERLALKAGAPLLARDAAAASSRVAAGRFHVACVGQFKRGKSTLLNALVGADVLPVGVLPVTSVPTLLRHGPALRARVRFREGAWQEIPARALGEYVSESHNPENVKGVTAAEVELPSRLLEQGLCLVDTPGLGSIFAADEAATRALVAQVDATLLVVGADPPLTGDELVLAAEVSRLAPDLLVVCNKADRIPQSDLAEATAFTLRALARATGHAVERWFTVSAAQPGAAAWPDWARLVEALRELAAGSRHRLVAASAARASQRIAAQLRAQLDAEAVGLVRPIEESEHHARELASLPAEGERSIGDMGPLLDAEERRVARVLESHRQAFLAVATREGAALLDARLATPRTRVGPALRRAALREVVAVARQLIEPWLLEEEDRAGALYGEAVGRFAQVGTEHLARVAARVDPGLLAGEDEMARLAEELSARSEFRFQPLLQVTEPAPSLRDLVDLVVVPLGVRREIARDARRLLAWLLEINSSRVQYDLIGRMHDSRGQLERAIREAIARARMQAEATLTAVRARLAEGRVAVERRLVEIDAIRGELDAL